MVCLVKVVAMMSLIFSIDQISLSFITLPFEKDLVFGSLNLIGAPLLDKPAMALKFDNCFVIRLIFPRAM